MKNTTTLISEFVSLLKSTNRTACIEKAISLEKHPNKGNSLALRSLDLTVEELTSFSKIISQCSPEVLQHFKSISLSYNDKIGDEGIVPFFHKLPNQIQQIGLVGCGIRDIGGQAILEWMQKATALEMICMEGNRFSNALKIAFDNYKKTHPNTVIIY